MEEDRSMMFFQQYSHENIGSYDFHTLENRGTETNNECRRKNSCEQNTSDCSAGSNQSVDQPPYMAQEPGSDSEALKVKIKIFIRLFDRDAGHLQTQVNKLKEITDSVEEVHRGATIGSISGGVMGAAGGITSIVGLILAPFTLGASLIVTGVGIGVAVTGGVTGAVSNITNMIKQKMSREEIEKILNTFQKKMFPMIDCLKEIEFEIEKIEIKLSKAAKVRAGIRAGAALAGGIRLARIADIGKVAAQVSRTVRVAGAISGVLSGLFVVLDIFFIAKDAIELDQMNNLKPGKKVKSDTLKFILEMRKTADNFQETLDELRKARGVLVHIQLI